jgi:hypothetical protein
LTPFDVISGARKQVYWQCPNDNDHIWAARIADRTKYGRGSSCPYCKESRGERLIRQYLKRHAITHRTQRQFPDSTIKLHRFDFSIEHKNFNGLIEFQGEQHYFPVNFGSRNQTEGMKNLIVNVVNDHKKEIFCEENNMPLLKIPFWEIHRIDEILDELFNCSILTFSDAPKLVLEYEEKRNAIRSLWPDNDNESIQAVLCDIQSTLQLQS